MPEGAAGLPVLREPSGSVPVSPDQYPQNQYPQYQYPQYQYPQYQYYQAPLFLQTAGEACKDQDDYTHHACWLPAYWLPLPV